MAGSAKKDHEFLYGCPFGCGAEFPSIEDLEKHAKTCPSNPKKDLRKIEAERVKAEKLRKEAEEAEKNALEIKGMMDKKLKESHDYKRTNGIAKEQVFGKYVLSQPVKIWGDDDGTIPGQGGFMNMLQYYDDKGFLLLHVFELPNRTPAAIFTMKES